MIPTDSALISRVEQTIRRQELFSPGDTLVIALSGGADSTLLLDVLTKLPGYALHLIAAHLNHCLRGVDSDADEEFCRHLAARHAIPFESRRVDVKIKASADRLNLEDAARRSRIEFLDEIRMVYGAAVVVLAHHADDQAETMLMRLLRGSGMTGLSGMAYRNTRGYVRPLLDISRPEIEQYLRRGSMEWREDASNSDTRYLRNRIRHQLLPLLETYNPAIRASLAATASIISGDETLLIELTEQAFAASCRSGEGEVVGRIAQFRALKPALRRRVLRQVLQQLTGTLERVSQRHIESICDLIDSERPNSRLTLPQSVTVVREYDRLLFICDAGEESKVVPGSGFELLITAPGHYQFPQGGSITVELIDQEEFPTAPATACFDLGKSPFPWVVRTFRPGDRIVPFGMSGRKKVKDIFIDRKIPFSGRRRIPLLFCGDELLWIASVCVSESSRMGTPSAASVCVTWEP